MSKLVCQRTVVPAAHKSVIYQLFLRAFTPEGTLNAASELLPHLAELGIDIVYLCPVCVHDPDDNPEFWSDRQKASGCNNPKNPYRISDYYHVEPEYGTDDDLKRFVRRAHGLGMKVMLDLVYFHCGPTAALIDEHPDFVVRNEDGTVRNGQWHFPQLNFDNPALREYLFDNMLYFVREFGVDGYRADVGNGIPVDFWDESRRRLDQFDPNIMMLDEGDMPEMMVNSFDMIYGFNWCWTLLDVMRGNKPATALGEAWTSDRDRMPDGALMTRHIDNHDIASDAYEQRIERVLDKRVIENALIVNMTMDGVPLLYNGNEIGDGRRHSLFASPALNPGFTIDWAQALTERGQDRLALVTELIALRHGEELLTEGDMALVPTAEPEKVFAFRRFSDYEDGHIFVFVSFCKEPVKCAVEADIDDFAAATILSRGGNLSFENGRPVLELLPYGALIVRA